MGHLRFYWDCYNRYPLVDWLHVTVMTVKLEYFDLIYAVSVMSYLLLATTITACATSHLKTLLRKEKL